MHCETTQPNSPAWWSYGPAPSAYDLADNTLTSNVGRLAVHVLLRAYLRVFCPTGVIGAERLDGLRGHLIVANHASHLDALVLLSAFALRAVNRVRSLCALDYFCTHPLRRVLAMLLGNSIPIRRDRFDGRATARCIEALKAGANVIVFPEGSRSRDGRLQPFKPGVALLALKHHVPVLPVYLRGTRACLPVGRFWPRSGRIDLMVGRPVQYTNMTSCRANWLAVASDLQRRVARLGNPSGGENDHDHYTEDPIPQGADGGVRAAQRGPAHRGDPRVHLRANAELRLPQSADRSRLAGTGHRPVLPVPPGMAGRPHAPAER